jgi:ferrous iron transport protein A
MESDKEINQSRGTVYLYNLPVGKSAVITSLNAGGITRRRMMDLGLVPGTEVEALRYSPFKDPRAFKIRGAVIALRREEGCQVLVEYKGE